MGRFLKLAECDVGNDKNVVVSVDIENKISVAQQMIIKDEDGKEQKIFIKNAINCDIDGLKRLNKTIEEALQKIDKKQ